MSLAIASPSSAEGWNASTDQARAWLPSASADLERVLVLLQTCRPRRPGGYNTVWANDEEGGGGPIHCAIGDDAALTEMRHRMTRARVLGVSYLPIRSAGQPVSFARFILFREGIVTSGSMTSVDYQASPQPCRSRIEGGASFRETREPLTKAPCRWFWRRSEG